MAAAEGNDSTVELLINSGANPSLPNKVSVYNTVLVYVVL